LEKQDKLHVAVIMDGNGRWATRRGLPRTVGHYEGIHALRRGGGAAPEMGGPMLTVFSFSCDNWRRPAPGGNALMAPVRRYLRTEQQRLIDNGVRLAVIGRRDRLPDGLSAEIDKAERASASGRRLDLRIAIDYSARDAITGAAAAWREERMPSREAFSRLL